MSFFLFSKKKGEVFSRGFKENFRGKGLIIINDMTIKFHRI